VSDIKVTLPEVRDRGGNETTPRLPRRTSVSRHGAISRELTKYSSYKSWTEKVRGAFAADVDVPAGSGSNPSRRTIDR
jgi:hypothetical protein